MISITVSSPERLYIQYIQMPPPIYQYVMNMVVSLPIRREVQVYYWKFQCANIVLLITRLFGVAKFTTLTPLSLLSWCRLSFPIISLIISSLSNFALKSLTYQNFHLGKCHIPAPVSHKNRLLIHQFSPQLMHAHSKQGYYTSHQWHPITNELCSLDWCTKNPLPNWRFSFPFSKKKIQSPALTVPPLSHITSCTPTKSNLYLANSLATVASDRDLYRHLTLHVLYQISCHFSFALIKPKDPSRPKATEPVS